MALWVPETVHTVLDLLLRRQPATGMISPVPLQLIYLVFIKQVKKRPAASGTDTTPPPRTVALHLARTPDASEEPVAPGQDL